MRTLPALTFALVSYCAMLAGCSQPRDDLSAGGADAGGADRGVQTTKPDGATGARDDAASTIPADAGGGDGGRPPSGDAHSDGAPAGELGSIARITAGVAHTCALNGLGQVWCWGDNRSGQLGDGTAMSSGVPVLVRALPSSTDVVAGGSLTCALDGLGVWCWGHGATGGDRAGSSLVPLQVPGVGATNVLALGDGHACASELFEAKTLCWGQDTLGQLGSGSILGYSTPVPVAGLPSAVELAAGKLHTCARQFDGTIHCWGFNESGQLGDGSGVSSSRGVLVTGLPGAAAIRTGSLHTCALTMGAAGAVWCWGSNVAGQVGSGVAGDARAPVQVRGLGPVTAIVAGAFHSCALLENGDVACWGRAIANGTLADAPMPVKAAGVSGARVIAAGAEHTCVLVDKGQVRCWGSNRNQQLGDGTSKDSATAVTVKP